MLEYCKWQLVEYFLKALGYSPNKLKAQVFIDQL